jgi:hypothetical protein
MRWQEVASFHWGHTILYEAAAMDTCVLSAAERYGLFSAIGIEPCRS